MVKEKQTKETEETTSTDMEKADETSSSTGKCNKAADETTTSTSTDDVEKAGLEQNPGEGAAAGSKDSNTVTPGKMTGQPQNVFVPPSNVPGNRMGSGTTPGQERYSGKSIEPDFMKSPLYVEVSKQIDSMSSAVFKKLESVEKSFNDRVANLMKMAEKIASFQTKSFEKAYAENIGQTNELSVEQTIQKGKAKFVS